MVEKHGFFIVVQHLENTPVMMLQELKGLNRNQVGYRDTILSRPGDFNGDGLMDWVASDWAHTGASGSSNEVGAIFINFNHSAP